MTAAPSAMPTQRTMDGAAFLLSVVATFLWVVVLPLQVLALLV